ncbi:uncharacterized protein PgNI_12199 [Pyricularia grisea]|uniref:Mannosyltransferase n=1 Tax=Pyricularia grisea TaxID=148305 RepID=A0A6P8AQB7_PYRGI|nr:uncharacterized protein PgNI_12199 [Pyricularia grisea]TLD04260.1 hypothetical protein PgNI_12199 [Pyricularia grisea]
MPPTDTSRQREFVHPDAAHAKKKTPPSPFVLQPITAFYFFLAANLIAAVFAPIQDCDETFNYWEPTHYLTHGYGLQTWEYSPEYSIRSWLYVSLHAIVANIRRVLPQSTKVSEFYFVRYVLAFICALTQTLLYRSISLTISPRTGTWFIMALVVSPGNFHASAAYLPSSFAMYACMLGAAAFIHWRGGLKTSHGIFWFAVAGVIGWPFAAALCVPFLAEEGLFALFGDGERRFDCFVRVGRGVVAALLLVVFDTCINTFFYRKIEVVSWNIVKYNIFSSSGGPNLYGTEPWTFYFRNLALNFNIWFVLAMLSMPLFLVRNFIVPTGHELRSGWRTMVFLTPFYMWLGIFTAQPHKEERFMYPAYPFLALNAAVAFHIIVTALGNANPKTLIGMIPGKLKLAVLSIAVLLAFDVSLARVYGVYTAYSAPLSLYKPLGTGVLGEQGLGGSGDSVCFGKEWYRFPSSFFLPRNMRAKFIRSEFRGLLPGEFSEARTGFGIFGGTWLTPSGMNDRNEEDMGKYVDINTCAFLVDTQYPHSSEPLPPNEPDFVADKDNWEVIQCIPFLDAGNTSFLARALWVPQLSFIPDHLQRKWGRHCLLQRRKVSSA